MKILQTRNQLQPRNLHRGLMG
ncbi:hypothetical protein Gotri_002841 [Gossypium trilobum]|uniref:Uncharacterized protein n=2 Tax=Gossypium TaxID=3633 RepID=A0A7J9CRD1_GOSGO|nr:hypothetical protein [Gossypium gossypioides]MBA0781961.1 hypothetical protein [Gossypium trilobum]